MNKVFEIPNYTGFGLPCFCHFGYISAHHTPHAANWHEDVEILACTKGSGYVEYDSEKIPMSQGEIVVINSDVAHRIMTDSHVEYFYLRIDPVFQSECGVQTPEIRFEPKINDSELYKIYMKIAQITESKDKYRILKMKIACAKLLLILVEKYIKNTDVTTEDSETVRVRKATEYIRCNYSNNFTVEDIAKYAGTSRSILAKEMKKHTGKTILEQVNTVRCKYAKNMILSGVKISEAAKRCGFDNKSYFTKTYKKYLGFLPIDTRNLPTE